MYPKEKNLKSRNIVSMHKDTFQREQEDFP